MALINIKNDVFDICDRIREIDSGYFIVYNTSAHRYEIHNKNQFGNTFCITVEQGLDSRVISKLRKSRIENIDKIIHEIDENNAKLEAESRRKVHDETSFKLKEMVDYAKKRESDCDFADSYQTTWC